MTLRWYTDPPSHEFPYSTSSSLYCSKQILWENRSTLFLTCDQLLIDLLHTIVVQQSSFFIFLTNANVDISTLGLDSWAGSSASKTQHFIMTLMTKLLIDNQSHLAKTVNYELTASFIQADQEPFIAHRCSSLCSPRLVKNI